MEELKIEFWKSLIDKGLLTISLVISGLLINNLLEKRRAKNTYFQKLAERKVDFYEKLWLHVFKIKILSEEFIGFLNNCYDLQLDIKNDKQDELNNFFKKINLLHKKGLNIIGGSQVHLTSKTFRLLNNVQQNQHLLSEIWNNPEEFKKIYSLQKDNELSNQCNELLFHLRKEVQLFNKD